MFQVKEFYKINRPEIIVAGEAVNRLTPSNSLVIAPYNGDTAFLYQTNRIGWPVVDRPIEQLIETITIMGMISILLALAHKYKIQQLERHKL